jgi:topoisomerase-4 subunit B
MAELQRLLRSKAVLLPGVTVTLTNAKTGDVRPGATTKACAAT